MHGNDVDPIEVYLIRFLKQYGVRRGQDEDDFKEALLNVQENVRNLQQPSHKRYNQLKYLLENEGQLTTDAIDKLVKAGGKIATLSSIPIMRERNGTPTDPIKKQYIIDMAFPQLDGTVLRDKRQPASHLVVIEPIHPGLEEYGPNKITDVYWTKLEAAYKEKLSLLLETAQSGEFTEAVVPPPNAFLSALRDSRIPLPEGVDCNSADLYAKQLFAKAASELNKSQKKEGKPCRLVLATTTRPGEHESVLTGIQDGQGDVTVVHDADMFSYSGKGKVVYCSMSDPIAIAGNVGNIKGQGNSAVDEALYRLSLGNQRELAVNPGQMHALYKAASNAPQQGDKFIHHGKCAKGGSPQHVEQPASTPSDRHPTPSL